MLLLDHQRRVARLLRGARHVDDLNRLFADLRLMKPGRASVQEIGNFAAHREERNSGITLQRVNDIQTSARLWHSQFQKGTPSADDIKRAGRANLNIMPEESIRERFGISRQTAQQVFNKGLRKFQERRPLKARELEVVTTLGLSMMWEVAFTGSILFSDFTDLLIEEGALESSAKDNFESVTHFVNLYALLIMHGTRLKLPDGDIAQLRLAASNSNTLRVVAHIPIAHIPKPITISVPLFETSLPSQTYCDPTVLTMLEAPIPVDIDGDRLVAL